MVITALPMAARTGAAAPWRASGSRLSTGTRDLRSFREKGGQQGLFAHLLRGRPRLEFGNGALDPMKLGVLPDDEYGHRFLRRSASSVQASGAPRIVPLHERWTPIPPRMMPITPWFRAGRMRPIQVDLAETRFMVLPAGRQPGRPDGRSAAACHGRCRFGPPDANLSRSGHVWGWIHASARLFPAEGRAGLPRSRQPGHGVGA